MFELVVPPLPILEVDELAPPCSPVSGTCVEPLLEEVRRVAVSWLVPLHVVESDLYVQESSPVTVFPSADAFPLNVPVEVPFESVDFEVPLSWFPLPVPVTTSRVEVMVKEQPFCSTTACREAVDNEPPHLVLSSMETTVHVPARSGQVFESL